MEDPKSKTSALKSRFLVLGLLQGKKVLTRAINHKIHSLMGGQEKSEGDSNSAEDHSQAIVLYGAANSELMESVKYRDNDEEDEDDGYPDLRHSLFNLEGEDENEDLGDANVSVIDMFRNAKEDVAEFSLEDEIDNVAAVFIRRFHKQIRMQKLESFKRQQEMLQQISVQE